MHLASFEYDGVDRIGAHFEGHLVDLHLAAAAAGLRKDFIAADMLALIARGPETLALVHEAMTAADRVEPIALDAVRWHPPVRRPGKICGVAMNNRGSDARKIKAPSHPMFFLKPASCLIGHGEEIVIREYYGGVHPEPELAVVIGRRATQLDPRAALDAVFGYTIFNDMTGNVMRGEDMVHYHALYASADDPDVLERREQHLSYAARYKGTDGFGPIGPWLVTKDEVENPNALDVLCSVGGDVIAEDSTQYLRHGVAEILSFLSHFQTLEPGDVVSMGTAFRPQEGSTRSLHTADLQRRDGPVEVTISGLGTLRNPVRREPGGIGQWQLPPA